MSKVFKQQTVHNLIGIVKNPIDIETIIHIAGQPSEYQSNGETYICSCLACQNPRCMRFERHELEINNEKLNEFPADFDDSVCPLDAIQWERGRRTPVISEKHCINCGICARRCPIGAIYSNGETAVVHSSDAEVTFVTETEENITKQQLQIKRLSRCRHEGHFIEITTDSIGLIYDKLEEQQTDAQFPNLIVRNMFIALGNICIIRRRGDVYFRIDAIAEDAPTIGVVEVEFNKDSLESPRAILDDIAVLAARYGVAKEQIKPFIVSLEFPNIRTEYWRVIKDIKDVLGVKIHSLSLGALCVLVSCFSHMPVSSAEFYADVDLASIKEGINALVGRCIVSDVGGRAIFEPKK